MTKRETRMARTTRKRMVTWIRTLADTPSRQPWYFGRNAALESDII